eukprot:1653897-Pyramimonas_sp.AAC.1
MTMIQYLVEGAAMTDFKILNQSKLGILLTVQAENVRAHDYVVCGYEEESGAWIREEVLAAEGILLQIYENIKDNAEE